MIEAHLDKAKGPVATLLVQNGTLKTGDVVAAGPVLGKVRAMVDDNRQRLKEAGPSFAVEALGFSEVPTAGDEFEVYPDEKSARAVVGDRASDARATRLAQQMASRRVSLTAMSGQANDGELKELNLILKADVQGSVEAILGSLEQLPKDEVQVRVLLSAPGEITETDVDLAAASGAVIVGFNTSMASGAKKAADATGVDVRDYDVIYKLLEDIQMAMEGLLEPELVDFAKLRCAPSSPSARAPLPAVTSPPASCIATAGSACTVANRWFTRATSTPCVVTRTTSRKWPQVSSAVSAPIGSPTGKKAIALRPSRWSPNAANSPPDPASDRAAPQRAPALASVPGSWSHSLELLLIRLVLAGADPGPVPGVERFLIWGVGALAPAVALWRRPADWGSLLLVRQPLASRNSDQLRISASHSGLSSRVAVVVAAIILLPVLWWLDNSAVLASEFSPVSGQSRLVTLLLVSPLSALIIWQLQQLVQAATQLLGSTATDASTDSSFRADAVATQRTSLGLQLLNLPALDWPEPAAPRVTPQPEAEQSKADVVEAPAEADSAVEAEEMDPGPNEAVGAETTESETDDSHGEATTSEDNSPEDNSPEDNSPEAGTPEVNADINSAESELPAEEGSTLDGMAADAADDVEAETTPDIDSSDDDGPDDDGPEDDGPEDDGPEDDGPEDNKAEDNKGDDHLRGATPAAPPESSLAAAASLPVEPEQSGEDQESTTLDAVSQVDRVAGGSTEGHREQAESSGCKRANQSSRLSPLRGSVTL